MRNTKIFLSLLVAFVVLSTLSTSVFAAISTGTANLNASINFNITMVNSTGYAIPLGQGAVPGSLMLVVNTTPELRTANTIADNISFTVPNNTFSFSLGVNNSNYSAGNYTVHIWINDSTSTPASYAKFTIFGVKLNYSTDEGGSGLRNINGSITLQYVPMGYYANGLNSTGPANHIRILGGFYLNTTNLTFSNISVVIPRFGIVPEFTYSCGNYNYSTTATFDPDRSPAYGCRDWGGQISPTVNNATYNLSHIIMNYSYITLAYQHINGTFFGERLYNMRPLVYGGGTNENAVWNVSILAWKNNRPKYFTFVPIFRFNTSNGKMYLASEGYAENIFFGTGVGNLEASPMEEPNVTEMLVYNLTFTINATPTASGDPRYVNISIKPRYINPGVVSGNESILIPAWNATMGSFSPGAGNKTMTVIFPNLSQIVYGVTWAGSYSECRWQGTVQGTRIHYSNVSNRENLNYPCNATTAEYSLQTGEINISVVSGNNSQVNITTVTMLFMPASNNDPKTKASVFSPVYIKNQTILGFGFTPDINSSAPKIGEGSVMTFFVQLNTTARNFTTINGTDLILRFMFPLNVTIWQGAIGTSTVNTSATLGSNIKLWMANDSNVNPGLSRVYNWTLLANQTHLLANATAFDAPTGVITLNGTGFANYTTARPGQGACETCDTFINMTQRNFSFVDNFPFSPTSGKNVSMWFILFDVNLTTFNGWMPANNGSVGLNLTLNLTASIDFKLLTENDKATGAVGSNTYNSTVSLGQASEVDFQDKLDGITSAPGVTVYVDGQKSGRYRKGSLIVSFDTAGTHTVSFDYNVPSTTAGAAVTPSSGGTTTAVTTGKVTKTYTTIEKGASQSISAADLADTKLTGLTITVANKVNDVTVTIEKLASKPADVSDLSVKKYQYISISHNLGSADVSKATFNFKIEKTWFTTNNVDKNKISLYRYTGGAWTELTTTKANEDANFVYYSATSSGLSTFLIGESGGVPAAAPAPTPTPTPTPAPTQQPTQPTIPGVPEIPGVPGGSITTIAIIIVVILGALILAWKMKLLKKK